MASDDSLNQPPAAPPPPGSTSHLVDPYSNGYLTTVTIAIIIPVTTLFIAIRLYTKYNFNKHGFVLADYICALAFAGLIGFMALGVWATKAGAGTHQWDVTAATEIRLAQIANYIEIMYNPSVLLAKLSVTIWVNILFFTAMMLCAVFQCWPREKIWDKTVVGTCGGTSAGLLASSSVSFVIDLTLLVLPIVCVWKLQMSAHRKWAISAVFAIGSFACVCSLMRVVSTVSLVRDKDLTFRLEELGLWSSGEIASGIIAGCMPIVPQFVRHVGPKIASTVNVTSRMRKSSSNGVRKAGPSPRSSRLSLKGLRGSADAFVELESQRQRFQRDWPSSEYGKDAMEKVHSYGN